MLWFLVTSKLNPFEPAAIFASDDRMLVERLHDAMDMEYGGRMHLAVLPENELKSWKITVSDAKTGHLIRQVETFSSEEVRGWVTDDQDEANDQMISIVEHPISKFLYAFADGGTYFMIA